MATIGFNPSDKVAEALRIRNSLLDETPEQWPVLLEIADSLCVRVYGFKNLAEFVTTSVAKNGLGMKIEQAKNLIIHNEGYKHKVGKLFEKLGIEEVSKSIDALDGHGSNQHGGVDKDKNVNSSNQGGNATNYRIAKLKRDHPEVGKRLEAGEFKTVSEAERAAGVRPEKPVEHARFRFYAERYTELAERICAKLPADGCRTLANEILRIIG